MCYLIFLHTFTGRLFEYLPLDASDIPSNATMAKFAAREVAILAMA
jgi:hypothetical protein